MGGHDNPGGGNDKGRFDGITYLYIRTNPADNGTEPLAAGLACWISPDITIIQPDGTEGGVAVAAQMNQMKVIVTNGGGIDAVDAYVEGFMCDPSTGFTPATAFPVGAGFLTIPGYTQASIAFPWSPAPADAGHRCLMARVRLTIPPDGYRDGLVFDVIGDRHVAQRNISVVDNSKKKMKQFSFAFALVNLAVNEEGAFTLRAAQVRPADDRQLQMMRGAVGCGFAQFSDKSLKAVKLDIGQQLPARDMTDPEGQKERPPMGLLPEPITPGRTSPKPLRMKPGEVRRAVVTITVNPAARAGDLQVVEIAQVNQRQQVVGGLWIVVQN